MKSPIGFMKFLFGNRNQREKAANQAISVAQRLANLREKLRRKQELTPEERDEINRLAQFRVEQYWGSSKVTGKVPEHKNRVFRRSLFRTVAFSELTGKFPGTDRRIRRSMARDLATRRWKTIRHHEVTAKSAQVAG